MPHMTLEMSHMVKHMTLGLNQVGPSVIFFTIGDIWSVIANCFFNIPQTFDNAPRKSSW